MRAPPNLRPTPLDCVGSVFSVGEGTLAWDIAKDAAQPIVCHFRRYDDAERSSEACRTASRLTSALGMDFPSKRWRQRWWIFGTMYRPFHCFAVLTIPHFHCFCHLHDFSLPLLVVLTVTLFHCFVPLRAVFDFTSLSLLLPSRRFLSCIALPY